MSAIKITKFGGELPSASSRVLGPEFARKAFNLLARVDEFRPVNNDVTKVTSAQLPELADADRSFLYRFKIDATSTPYANDTLGWRTNAEPLNYVNGQVDDLNTERVYVSFMDGTVWPVVVDATSIADVNGIKKPLGIPAPAAAPVVALNKVSVYTVEENALAQEKIPSLVLDALKDNLVETPMGVTPTLGTASPITTGWLTHAQATAAGLGLTTAAGDWAFLQPITGGDAVVKRYAYLMDSRFGGKSVTYLGQTYWGVPMTLQGTGYSVNTSALSAVIQAIDNPDPEVIEPLVPLANANAYAQRLADFFLPTTDPQKPAVEALNAAIAEFMNADAADDNAALLLAMTAFYARAEVHQEMLAAYSSFATDMMTMQGILYPGAPNIVRESLVVLLDTGAYNYTTSEGVKALNYYALESYIVGLAESGIATDFAGDAATIAANKARIKSYLTPALDKLQSTLSESHWATYENWPLGSRSSSIDAARADRMYAAVQSLRTAAKQVTAAYSVAIENAVRVVREVFTVDIAPYLPEPVTTILDTCFYVTTFVTSWGEESSPSMPTPEITRAQYDTVSVNRPTEIADATFVATYRIVGWRLYRSNQGSGGVNNAQLVAGGSRTLAGWDPAGYFPNATTSITDDRSGAELGEVLPTLTWLPPRVASAPVGRPDPYLRGLCGMANGVMAGFIDNTVYFSEPYVPYAWPVQNELTVPHKIVGLGSFGQSLFVGTQGSPYIFSGADSASMTRQDIPGDQACVSARSIASVESGVLYASPDGICLVDQSGVRVMTQKLFTKNDWEAINPSSIVAAVHDGVYYFLYNNRATSGASNTGLEWDDPYVTPANMIALYEGIRQMIWDGDEVTAKAIYNKRQADYGFSDATFAAYTEFTAAEITAWKNNTPTAMTKLGTWATRTVRPSGCYALDFVTGKLTEIDVKGTALYVDKATDTLYYIDGTSIKAMFADKTSTRVGAYWTGIIQTPKYDAMAWLQVDSTFANPVTVRWYADGALRYVATVATNKPVRLPAGRYREHMVCIESSDRITSLTMASSTDELKGV